MTRRGIRDFVRRLSGLDPGAPGAGRDEHRARKQARLAEEASRFAAVEARERETQRDEWTMDSELVRARVQQVRVLFPGE